MDDVKRGDMETAMRMVCKKFTAAILSNRFWTAHAAGARVGIQCTVPRQRPEPIARAVNPILAGGAVRSRLAS